MNVKTNNVNRVSALECIVWDDSLGRYETLSDEACRDLSDSILEIGEQTVPAVVRPYKGDHSYEVITGLRRHWVVSWLNRNGHPHIKFMVEVRDLTDEEAFRLRYLDWFQPGMMGSVEQATYLRDGLRLYYTDISEMAARLRTNEVFIRMKIALLDEQRT